jgi:hypothetical protein
VVSGGGVALNIGAARFDLVNPLPPFFADQSPRPIDEKLWTYTARRPVAEWSSRDPRAAGDPRRDRGGGRCGADGDAGAGPRQLLDLVA